MAPFRFQPTNQSDQDMSAAAARNRSPDQTQDNGFLQNIMAAMGGANAAPRATLPVPTAPNTII